MSRKRSKSPKNRSRSKKAKSKAKSRSKSKNRKYGGNPDLADEIKLEIPKYGIKIVTEEWTLNKEKIKYFNGKLTEKNGYFSFTESGYIDPTYIERLPLMSQGYQNGAYITAEWREGPVTNFTFRKTKNLPVDNDVIASYCPKNKYYFIDNPCKIVYSMYEAPQNNIFQIAFKVYYYSGRFYVYEIDSRFTPSTVEVNADGTPKVTIFNTQTEMLTHTDSMINKIIQNLIQMKKIKLIS
jgi:hypothetical protein